MRTATLAYDAVTLIIALVKTQGPQGINDTVLTNASGFNGIDGVLLPPGRHQRRGLTRSCG